MLRVIHPNRWFFWTIAGLIATGLVVMFFLQQAIREINQNSDAIVDSIPKFIDSEYPGWHTLRPEGFGLSIKYPPGWQVEIDRFDANTVTLENAADFEENIAITVTDPKNEKLIRQSVEIGSEQEIIVDGKAGKRLRGADKNDKATANIVLARHDDKLYSFSGSAALFDKIVESVRFLSP